MADPTPTQPSAQSTQVNSLMPSPWRCFLGSLIAGLLAGGLYLLTSNIAQAFADKPIHSVNVTTINIAIAVRTLVVGIFTLGTGVFSLAALGLFALAIQILVRGRSHSTPSA